MKNYKKNGGDMSLVSFASEEIKQSILSGDIKQNELLSESQLALTLGVSRTPVREAIRMLVSENIVEVINGIGIFVKQLTPREIKDIFEVRMALESIASGSAVHNIADEEIELYKDRFIQLLGKYQSGEITRSREFADLDWALHELIIDRSSNEYLRRIMKEIYFNIKRLQLMSFEALNDIEKSTGQHLLILDCIKKNDIELLDKVLKEHISWSMDQLIDKI